MKNPVFRNMLICIAVAISGPFAFGQTDNHVEVTASDDNHDQAGNYVKGITSGRAISLVSIALALSSLVIGWRIKRRPSDLSDAGRVWNVIALIFGGLSMLVSSIQLLMNAGGLGSGGGKAGAIVALILAFIGVLMSLFNRHSLNQRNTSR